MVLNGILDQCDIVEKPGRLMSDEELGEGSKMKKIKERHGVGLGKISNWGSGLTNGQGKNIKITSHLCAKQQLISLPQFHMRNEEGTEVGRGSKVHEIPQRRRHRHRADQRSRTTSNDRHHGMLPGIDGHDRGWIPGRTRPRSEWCAWGHGQLL